MSWYNIVKIWYIIVSNDMIQYRIKWNVSILTRVIWYNIVSYHQILFYIMVTCVYWYNKYSLWYNIALYHTIQLADRQIVIESHDLMLYVCSSRSEQIFHEPKIAIFLTRTELKFPCRASEFFQTGSYTDLQLTIQYHIFLLWYVL